MKIDIPYFETRKDGMKWVYENQKLITFQKKSEIKEADGVAFKFMDSLGLFYSKGSALKASESVDVSLSEIAELKVKAIINTTNLIDSHLDLHIPKMWNKSLKEVPYMLHLQEHKSGFEFIIADGEDVKAYTRTYTWKELGFAWEGTTEGLTFDSIVKRERNSTMHKNYAKGRVRNHSVGMRYVRLVTCIDNKDYGAEYEAWEKYLPMAVNPEIAEEKGYFWAVPEAKVIEGSAVVRGSNYATPTQSVSSKDDEPPLGTHGQSSKQEPPLGIPIDYVQLNKMFL